MTALQAFFGWPDGGVWANILAWVLGLVIAAGCGWLFRDHIGRHLVAWLHKHHQAHVERMAAGAPARAGAGSNPAEGAVIVIRHTLDGDATARKIQKAILDLRREGLS